MEPFSVVIIVKGRQKQLHNVLDSIIKSSIQPNDIQIVVMDDIDEYAFTDSFNLPIFKSLLPTSTLLLASARNQGARLSKTDQLIFLDVDCIVQPTLFEDLLKMTDDKVIISAYPLYLPFVPDSGNYETLKENAVKHPDRSQIKSNTPTDYKKFWSLIFSVRKQTYNIIGGFDTEYVGYGAEDTDFARTFHEKGISLLFIKSYILHQYHNKHNPPLNHFEAIVINALIYKKKWGEFAMYSWLKHFENMKLIELKRDTIQILRYPTMDEIQSSLSTKPY